jgi:glycosyltransferase involved in cell wall biosynthesis
VASPFFKEKFSFTVYALKDGPLRQELEEAGIRCHVFSYPEKLDFLLPLNNLYAELKKYALVHLHLGKASFYGKLTQAIFKTIPTVVSIHGLEKQRYRWADFWLYLFAEKYLFVSEYLYSHPYFAYLPAKMKKIIYPTSSFLEENVKFISSREKIILWCGRLEKIKGADLLEAIVQSFLQDNFFIDWKLAIIGEGKYKNYFLRRFKGIKRVVFPAQTEKLSYYQKASLFLNTSREEALGISMIDALRFGIPIVGFEVGGIKEVVSNDKIGSLVKPFDTKNYLEEMKGILQNKVDNSFLTSSYQKRFSPFRFAKEIAAVYFKSLRTKDEKRILYFISSSQFGGGEQNAYLLAKYMQKKNYQPLFLIKKASSKKSALLREKLKTLSSEIHTWWVGDNFDLFTLLKLPFLIKGRNIKVLHTHLNRAAILSFLSPVPVISTVHGQNKAIYYKFSDLVIAVSKTAKEHLTKQGLAENKIKVIPNFVELNEFSSRKFFPKNIIYVGRLHYKKRIDIAIKLLSLLNSEWSLLLVGEGAEKDNLQNLAKSLGLEGRVKFLGYQKKVEQFLKEASFFILPSESESCPLSLLEAMFQGVIPLLNDIKPLREILSEDMFYGNNKEGAKSYLKCLLFFWKNKEKMQLISQKMRKKVEKEYSPSKIMIKYEKIYASFFKTMVSIVTGTGD